MPVSVTAIVKSQNYKPMKNNINNMIPAAIEAITDSKMAKESGVVNKEYKGYISSMGASIMQAGLLPTIAFFANDENKKADSSKLLDAVLLLINPDYQERQKLINYVIESCKPDNYVENNDEGIGLNNLDQYKLMIMEEEISDALIALKLAIRTFKFSK